MRLRPFLLALGFLTRLCPAMPAERREMSDSCIWYPAVGVTLGLLLFFTAYSVFSLTASATIAGWSYVLFSAWLTRALHFDGIADIADALGSGKTGPEFRAVLKDSRIGSFGSLAIVLTAGGQIAAASACLQADAFLPLFFAPVFGRSLPMLFTAMAPMHPDASLGSILADAPATTCRFFSLAAIVILGPFCLGFGATFLALCALCPVFFFLARVARREGGYNGDFFGALILAGECIALIAGTIRPLG